MGTANGAVPQKTIGSTKMKCGTVYDVGQGNPHPTFDNIGLLGPSGMCEI